MYKTVKTCNISIITKQKDVLILICLQSSYLCTYQYIITNDKQPNILKFRSTEFMNTLLG